jgi:hypothetical protein
VNDQETHALCTSLVSDVIRFSREASGKIVVDHGESVDDVPRLINEQLPSRCLLPSRQEAKLLIFLATGS